MKHQRKNVKAKALFCGVIALLMVVLTGCSSMKADALTNDMGYAPSEKDYAYDYDYMLEAEKSVMEDNTAGMGTTADSMEAPDTSSTAENDLANRKLIRNMRLTVETREYDKFLSSLQQEIGFHGGYIQSGETNGSSHQSSYATRWASYTIRVPVDRYDAFVSTVSALGNVTYKNESVQDVTMAYTDVESHIRALETEYETLLTILAKCTELKDVLTVQNRITEVNYQLDSYKSQLRRYDDLIAYCTVYLSVEEVEKITVPVEEKTVGERIVGELSENCEDIVEDAEDFAVWFVSSLPYIGIWILVIALILLLFAGLKRSIARKEQKRRMGRKISQQEQEQLNKILQDTTEKHNV